MEEADILGDRISIINNGMIKCFGSSLYLKQLFGVGYTFKLSLNCSPNHIKPQIDNIVSYINGVKTINVSSTEIIYNLPFDESKHFSIMFDKLVSNRNNLKIKTFGISITTLEQILIKICRENEINHNLERKRRRN